MVRWEGEVREKRERRGEEEGGEKYRDLTIKYPD